MNHAQRIILAKLALDYLDERISNEDFFKGLSSVPDDRDPVYVDLMNIVEHLPGKDDERYQEYYDGAKEIIDRILGEE